MRKTALRMAAAGLLLVSAAISQEKDFLIAAPEPAEFRHAEAVGHRMATGPAATFEFVSSEMGVEGKTVKGAPYSAEAVSENTQVLNDGNRISRKSSTMLYRDGEGRTRREVSLGSIGPWAAADRTPVKLVMIHDPVAGVSYTLDEKSKTARKVSGKGMVFSYARSGPVEAMRVPPPPPPPPGAAAQSFEIELGAAPDVHIMRAPAADDRNAKTESLGKRNMEGVVAEGTRTTLTIPAGEIGNERPIEVVTERWFSPELQTVVMSRHVNPMTGEHVYKLTNLRRGEPLKSLFEVPADYTVKEDGPGMRMMRKIEDARSSKESN